MRLTALTGGIATGKSYCLAGFASSGVPVIDADRLAHEAVAPKTAGLAAVVSRFGAGVLRPDGTLDRPAVARIVFADAEARAALEAIVHPEVYRRIRAWGMSLPPDTPVAIADVPLLFETRHDRDFEQVIVCACDAEVQVRRLMARDSISQADARARIAAQWPIEDKVARADYVIRTDGSFADTNRQIAAVLEALRGRR
jgi:dephospho-CoA kinase